MVGPPARSGRRTARAAEARRRDTGAPRSRRTFRGHPRPARPRAPTSGFVRPQAAGLAELGHPRESYQLRGDVRRRWRRWSLVALSRPRRQPAVDGRHAFERSRSTTSPATTTRRSRRIDRRSPPRPGCGAVDHVLSVERPDVWSAWFSERIEHRSSSSAATRRRGPGELSSPPARRSPRTSPRSTTCGAASRPRGSRPAPGGPGSRARPVGVAEDLDVLGVDVGDPLARLVGVVVVVGPVLELFLCTSVEQLVPSSAWMRWRCLDPFLSSPMKVDLTVVLGRARRT